MAAHALENRHRDPALKISARSRETGLAEVGFVQRLVQDALEQVSTDRSMLPGLRFADPVGDPGWFGPDSAMWYLQSHPSGLIGGFVSLMCEALMPDMAYAAIDHSDFFTQFKRRGGRSGSFYWATVFGPTDVAERVCQNVHRYHAVVTGTRPDGRPYAANDPGNLRWAHAGLTYGFIRGHLLYHPRPLGPDRLDDVVAGFARIHAEIGGTDLPATMADLRDYYRGIAPQLALTPQAKSTLDFMFGKLERIPVLRWALVDALPTWSRDLLPHNARPTQRLIGRRVMTTAINGTVRLGGEPWVVRQARKRFS